VIGLIATLFLAGLTLGTLVGGTWADYVGRKVALTWSVALYTIFAALTGLANSVGLLGFIRFLTGVGGGTELPVGSVFITEVSPPKYRGFLVTAMTAIYGLGVFGAGGLAATVGEAYGWRWAFGALIILGAFVFFIRGAVVESHRYSKIRKALEGGQIKRHKVTLVELFSSQYRWTTIRLVIMWMGTWVAAWGIQPFWGVYLVRYAHVPLARVGAYMAIFGLSMVAVAVISGIVSDLVGRRWALTLFTAAYIVSLWWWMATANQGTTLILGALSFGFYMALGCLPTPYAAECYPTAIRGTGQSITVGLGRVPSVFAPLVGGLLINAVGLPQEWRIFSLFFILAPLAMWLGPETKGKVLTDTLEETALAD
jgi:putative MFS transporter